MWYLAWRNTVRRQNPSMLTVTITGLTVFTFVIIFSVFLIMQEGLSLSSERLGADVIVLPDEAKADAYQTLFTANPAYVYMPKYPSYDICSKGEKADVQIQCVTNCPGRDEAREQLLSGNSSRSQIGMGYTPGRRYGSYGRFIW